MCDDVRIELEALEATYDGAVSVSPGPPAAATVSLAPRGCPLVLASDAGNTGTRGGADSMAAAEARCFVRVTLVLACDAAYPKQPPAIKLQQPRGVLLLAYRRMAMRKYSRTALLRDLVRLNVQTSYSEQHRRADHALAR